MILVHFIESVKILWVIILRKAWNFMNLHELIMLYLPTYLYFSKKINILIRAEIT